MNSIVDYLNDKSVRENIRGAVGGKMDQLITSTISLVNSNPRLAECDYKSLLSASLVAATLDLPVSLGFAYIIPYETSSGLKAQFQMGYKGFIQLAIRSGQFKTINVTDVREGEIKKNDRLTGKITFKFALEDRDQRPIVGYVAYFKLIKGFEKQLYMTKEELESHGIRFSDNTRRGVGMWREDFDMMAKKTVLKLLLSKYAPMTVDMQNAQLADQAVIEDKEVKYVDNTRKKVDPHAEAARKERERIVAHIERSVSIIELYKCLEAVSTSADASLRELYNKKKSLLEEPKEVK